VREAAVETGLPAAFADRLVARYGELEPRPEVGEVLGRLAEIVPLAIVTNCSEPLGQLVAARIDIVFKAVITAERAGYCKPHPRPYRLALEALGLRPDECLFVAGSAYDLTGAGSVGLPVFWHDRIGMTLPPGAPAPVGRYDTLFPLLPLVLGPPAA
jgi:2-haloacid dehalogenase